MLLRQFDLLFYQFIIHFLLQQIIKVRTIGTLKQQYLEMEKKCQK